MSKAASLSGRDKAIVFSFFVVGAIVFSAQVASPKVSEEREAFMKSVTPQLLSAQQAVFAGQSFEASEVSPEVRKAIDFHGMPMGMSCPDLRRGTWWADGSGTTAILEYRGRRSGRVYAFAFEFVESGSGYVLKRVTLVDGAQP